jgi:hypothetical protein
MQKLVQEWQSRCNVPRFSMIFLSHLQGKPLTWCGCMHVCVPEFLKLAMDAICISFLAVFAVPGLGFKVHKSFYMLILVKDVCSMVGTMICPN